jgi:hypothetical protein
MINIQIDDIKTREDLAKFVTSLGDECNLSSHVWENNDLLSFLRALAAWIEDMDGYYLNQGLPVPKMPEWKTLAQMLAAAKHYE